MKRLFVFVFLILVATSPLLHAKDDITNYDELYMSMVKNSEQMPDDFNFGKIREIYPKTSFFVPYAMHKQDFRPLLERVDARDETALPEIEEYVRLHFPFVEVHSRAVIANKEFEKKDAVAYHDWAVRGIVKAMYASGDARSKETAMTVLNVSEEYLVARQIGKVTQQRLVNDEGHVYDVLNVSDIKNGESLDLWFYIAELFRE